MRIPKFRIYDKHLKIIRDVNYIDFKGKEVMFYADDFKDDKHCPSLDIVRNFDEVEIMQSTGSKDKKGVEIFEGDVVEFDDITSEFNWSDMDDIAINCSNRATLKFDGLTFYLDDFAVKNTRHYENVNDIHYDFKGFLGDCVVIGNKFQNPELLEVE